MSDTNSASVILFNKGSRRQLFEFGVPTNSHLQVTPRVGCLSQNSSIRIQLDFAPPQGLMQQEAAATAGNYKGTSSACIPCAIEPATAGPQSNAAAGGSGPANAGQPDVQQSIVGVDAKDINNSSSQNRWFWFREWLIPCYVKPADTHEDLTALDVVQNSQAVYSVSSSSSLTASDANAPGLGSQATVSSSSSNDSVCVLHLAVQTCAVAPELHLVSPELMKPSGKNYFVMDFGALPVGERLTRQLELANSGGLLVRRAAESKQVI